MQASASEMRAGRARPAGIRILVVDDEVFTRLYFRDLLSELGHMVVETAESASCAVAAARRHRPDLVLMDVRLPGERDGIDAAAEIRSRLGIPSIFLTAHSDARTRDRAAAARPLDFLVKPFSPDKIAGALRRAADRFGFDQA